MFRYSACRGPRRTLELLLDRRHFQRLVREHHQWVIKAGRVVVADLERYMAARGYPNRSEAIRDLARIMQRL
jgi:hypothetical protein